MERDPFCGVRTAEKLKMEQKYNNSVALQVPQTAPSNSSPLLEENEICGALKMTMVTTNPDPVQLLTGMTQLPPPHERNHEKEGIDTISLNLYSSFTHNVCHSIKHYKKHTKKQEITPSHFQEIKYLTEPE